MIAPDMIMGWIATIAISLLCSSGGAWVILSLFIEKKAKDALENDLELISKRFDKVEEKIESCQSKENCSQRHETIDEMKLEIKDIYKEVRTLSKSNAEISATLKIMSETMQQFIKIGALAVSSKGDRTNG